MNYIELCTIIKSVPLIAQSVLLTRSVLTQPYLESRVTPDQNRPGLPRVVDVVEFFLEDDGDGESLRDLKLRKLCFLQL